MGDHLKRNHELWSFFLLPLSYILVGHLSLMLAVPPGYATMIFIPAGLAVGSAFALGYKALPGVFIGSFGLNLWAGLTINGQLDYNVSLVIAFASTIQALVGGAILLKYIKTPANILGRVEDVFTSVLLAPAICIVSSTLSLSIMHFILGMTFNFAQNWLSWWVGDTLGVALVMPLILFFSI